VQSLAGDLIRDQHSLLIEQLNDKYFLQCTERCFQLLEVETLKHIPQSELFSYFRSSTCLDSIHQCCKVSSHPQWHRGLIPYFIVTGYQSLVLYALSGEKIKELLRIQLEEGPRLSLTSLVRSEEQSLTSILIAISGGSGNINCMTVQGASNTPPSDWHQVSSFQLIFPSTDTLPFLAHHLCSLHHANLDTILVCACLDGRILIYDVLGSQGTLADSFCLPYCGGIQKIFRGPEICHRSADTSTPLPSFIANCRNENFLFFLGPNGRWRNKSIFVPFSCRYLTPLPHERLQQSSEAPSPELSYSFPTRKFAWFDEAPTGAALNLGELCPPSRERIVPDLFHEIRGAVMDLISVQTESVRLILVSWKTPPNLGAGLFGLSLFSGTSFEMIWTENFPAISAISECPLPPESHCGQSHWLASFLVVEDSSRYRCFGVSSAPRNGSGSFTVHLITTSSLAHNVHLSPQLLSNDALIYCTESALVAYKWVSDFTLLDANSFPIRRSATLSFASAQAISNQVCLPLSNRLILHQEAAVPVDFTTHSSPSSHQTFIFLSLALAGVEYWCYDPILLSFQVADVQVSFVSSATRYFRTSHSLAQYSIASLSLFVLIKA
jgi:hypothetical protein